MIRTVNWKRQLDEASGAHRARCQDRDSALDCSTASSPSADNCRASSPTTTCYVLRSARHICRVEFHVTYSKQRIGAHSTRHTIGNQQSPSKWHSCPDGNGGVL